MMSCRSPEVITISDSDEEESLDIFDSVEDEDARFDGGNPDSDDVFSSSHCDLDNYDGKDVKRSSTPRSSDFNGCSRRCEKRENRRVRCNLDIQCSSSIINSLQRNYITTPTGEGNDHVTAKESLIDSDCVKSVHGNFGSDECAKKVRSGPWAIRQMDNIAKKIEERKKIMEELVQKDENFFTVFHDKDPDLSQNDHVTAKGSLIDSDHVESVHGNVESDECATKVRSGLWAIRHMDNIAKKFEERKKIMEELVQKDGNFFTVFNDNDSDLFQKNTKAMLADCAVIRKKADRAKLQGVTCATSKAYFDALGLSPESKERRINKVSRVRVVAQRMPSTPENYWEVGFPSESEQRRRGLIKEVYVESKGKKGRNLFQGNT